MVCSNLSDLNCAAILESEQSVKMMYIIFLTGFSIFMLLFYDKYFKDDKSYVLGFLPRVLKFESKSWLGFLPITLLMYQTVTPLEIFTGFIFVFYLPFICLVIWYFLISLLDWILTKSGLNNVFKFQRRLKNE